MPEHRAALVTRLRWCACTLAERSGLGGEGYRFCPRSDRSLTYAPLSRLGDRGLPPDPSRGSHTEIHDTRERTTLAIERGQIGSRRT
jgi:hypothetical protein